MGDGGLPAVINWRHPGVQVVLTGDFNGWTQDSLMQKDGNEFWSVLNLTPGTYHYKVRFCFAAWHGLSMLTRPPLSPAVCSRWGVDVRAGSRDGARRPREYEQLHPRGAVGVDGRA
jgi:hypothetical protein